MDYYKKLFETLDQKMKENNFDEAKKLIEEELKMPYIPREIEDKLHIYLKTILEFNYKPEYISDEKILAFLNGDENHQLIGVDILNKKNLRDYIDVCEDFLTKDRFVNAKMLLIDSLVNQEVKHDFICVKDNKEIPFNPGKMMPIYESEEYLYGIKLLEKEYMKEPSKQFLASKVLNQYAMMHYPLPYTREEIIKETKEIIAYISEAFNSAE